eukprot:CAMPEP_0196579964 /NCGR_PEP_ID=MMETSP1081-20130531/25993_1 /TAXON_ID=36882 /ORGANISM="Pyramimonas amylifera, Strain CCMP720" /LENGTH=142 /DNA_ID=CAMNT_0041899701 /DNA_START=246 /DNA_END=674 /DNA_ORIENTATION=-
MNVTTLSIKSRSAQSLVCSVRTTHTQRPASCSTRAHGVREFSTIINRRRITQSAVAIILCAGANESKAASDVQTQAQAVAEAQAKQAAEIAKRAQEGADRAKEQQAANVSKAQEQQSKDVAKAEKDQAALKKFLLGLFGFGK